MSDFAVVCRTCLHTVYEGDTAPDDGQVLLTAYADSIPGTVCPSKIDPCPHKAAAIAAAQLLKPASQGDLAAIKTRIAAVEAKTGVVPVPPAKP